MKKKDHFLNEQPEPKRQMVFWERKGGHEHRRSDVVAKSKISTCNKSFCSLPLQMKIFYLEQK